MTTRSTNSNAIPSKILIAHKGRNSQIILKKESTVGRLTLSDFTAYYKAEVIRTVWY